MNLSETLARPLVIMADELSGVNKDSRIDARNLWLPVSVVVGVGATLIIIGMFVQSIRQGASTTSKLEVSVAQIIESQATMQGSLNALMSMQATVADTKAEVGSMRSEVNDMKQRLQVMEAWISTTRERMIRAGIQPPDYQSGGK